GMPDYQIAARTQVLAELAHDLALGLLLEIDQHVAAEDDVDVAIDRIFPVHQVHAHEIGELAQFRHHAHLVAQPVARAQEIALDELARYRRERVAGIDRSLGDAQHGGRDVGTEDAEAHARATSRHVVEHNGGRIGFHPGRAGRAPYFQLGTRALLQERGHRYLSDKVEM